MFTMDTRPWFSMIPGSSQEKEHFSALQARLAPMFATLLPNPREPRTIVVIPSLSLDTEELAKLVGVNHYEERLLCLLLLLQMPNTHVIYVTSEPLKHSIVEYYLHLVPGVPSHHARKRLHTFSCHDASSTPLSQKVLLRPRLMQHIQSTIVNRDATHMVCFNTTGLERTLAVQLGLPLFGCDPELSHLGSKSHGRELFREAGIPLPDGYEHLSEEQEIFDAVTELKQKNPDLRKAVVKLNEGFSGEGNAIFSYEGAPRGSGLRAWVAEHLPQKLRFEAETEDWAHYSAKFKTMQGIVEAWLEGEDKRSPSVQCRIA
ncbi:MAG: carboxylate-amine ligase, partial [Myxococcota bacterium]